MTSRQRARRRTIRRRRIAAGLVAIAATAAALGYEMPASSSPPRAFTIPLPTADEPVVVPRERRGDSAVPAGTTVFDETVAGVTNLDGELLAALREAATDAPVEFLVDSGWRSAEYQERLRVEAVAKYGSEAEAARWVATPKTSAHVSGDAVDLGPAEATAWLSTHGASYGLCQIYDNEPWHYELRPDAVEHGCPPMYADPTHDPRMHS